MKIKVVYATDTVATGRRDGLPVRLVRGTVWAADDPICIEHPELFSEDPIWIMRTTPDPVEEVRRVEQATRNPGQLRNR